jgi:hypothetical protein
VAEAGRYARANLGGGMAAMIWLVILLSAAQLIGIV